MVLSDACMLLATLSTTVLLATLTGIVLYFFVNYLFSRTHLARCINKIPTVHIPIWMLMWGCQRIKLAPPQAVLMQVLSALCHLYQSSKIFCIWLTFRPAVMFYKPETVEALLKHSKTNSKSIEYSLGKEAFGNGLFINNGEEWHRNRKNINPAFHSSVLEESMGVFNEQSMVLVKILLAKGEKGNFFDIDPLSKYCALDIICETAMGVPMHAQIGEHKEFFEAISKLEESVMLLILRPWLWCSFSRYFTPMGRDINKRFKIVQDITKEMMKKKMTIVADSDHTNLNGNPEINKNPKKKRKAFLDLLLEWQRKNGSFTNENLLDEVKTFMLAGHDTVAVTLSYTMHNLGNFLHIQDRVLQEIDSIFGNDSTRPVTTDDLNNMKYMECVIKETLRLYPGLPLFARSVEEGIKILDYTIPPGSLCLIFTVMLHRDPESFPDPEKFDPERFYPENCAKRHPYAFIPFSVGPRNCIGQKYAMMEMKVILANILRNMRVISLDKHDSFHFIPGVFARTSLPYE